MFVTEEILITVSWPTLLFLTPRLALSSHQNRTFVCLFWCGNLQCAHSPANSNCCLPRVLYPTAQTTLSPLPFVYPKVGNISTFCLVGPQWFSDCFWRRNLMFIYFDVFGKSWFLQEQFATLWYHLLIEIQNQMDMALVNDTLYKFFPPTYSSTLMFALLIYKLKTKRESEESLRVQYWWVSCPPVLVCVLDHLHFNLMSLVLFQIG